MESIYSDLQVQLVEQMLESIQTISKRSEKYSCADDFLTSFEGKMALDSICMQFIALGECLKRLDKSTNGQLVSEYPDIPWKDIMVFRDIVAHKYFDIDADQVYWIISKELTPLRSALDNIKDRLLNIKL